MYLILTMAGLYSRFTNAGYKLPKYLLPWGERSILAKILQEMKSDNAFDDIFLIGNKKDVDYSPHIHATMTAFGIDNGHLLFVGDTSGQAETAALGLEFARPKMKTPDAPIVFHNIDTILYDREFLTIKQTLLEHDGYIDIFSSRNQQYSYVILDSDGKVEEIAEKKVVSDKATSGLYGFKNCDTFLKHYSSGSDIYIADIYKKLLSGNASISVGELHTEKNTIVLGTPDEYIQRSMTVEMRRIL